MKHLRIGRMRSHEQLCHRSTGTMADRNQGNLQRRCRSLDPCEKRRFEIVELAVDVIEGAEPVLFVVAGTKRHYDDRLVAKRARHKSGGGISVFIDAMGIRS